MKNNPIFKYTDLRFALEWSETAKQRISEETPYALEEAIKLTHNYLKNYCDSINLEEK